MRILLILFPMMIFIHLVADFILQGILASFKEKEWWKKNAPNPLYKDDWFISLLAHSYMWSFLTFLPTAIVTYMLSKSVESTIIVFYIVTSVNTIIHAIVDDLKCNKYKINLTIDQYCHINQIYITCHILAVAVWGWNT